MGGEMGDFEVGPSFWLKADAGGLVRNGRCAERLLGKKGLGLEG